MPAVLLLNGPNLDLLGKRDPAVYGSATLADVEDLARRTAADLGLDVVALQSNHEGALIDALRDHREDTVGVVVNAGGYSHTSIALRDALETYPHPVVEVHLSNIHAREEFRHRSFVSLVADAVIVGAGAHGYALAVRHLATLVG